MQIHTLSGYIQHIYLVEDGQQLMLLDGCSRADVGMVCNFIQHTLKRPLSDLKLIVVTHMHPDHAGGANKLRKLCSAKIIAHPKARKWYAGLMGRAAHLIDIGLALWVASRLGRKRQHIYYRPILTPDYIAADEQTLPGFEDWQVVYTPGHTDHDISLFHQPSGQMYIADVMVQVKGQLTPPYPVCHPNQYRQSLKRVQNKAPQSILCAHVAPMLFANIDFDAILAQAPSLPKNHWHSAKNRIARVLGKNLNKH